MLNYDSHYKIRIDHTFTTQRQQQYTIDIFLLLWLLLFDIFQFHNTKNNTIPTGAINFFRHDQIKENALIFFFNFNKYLHSMSFIHFNEYTPSTDRTENVHTINTERYSTCSAREIMSCVLLYIMFIYYHQFPIITWHAEVVYNVNGSELQATCKT